jgi:hypothetical protein
MLPPFAINMAFFIFGFMMAKILDIANLIVNYSIGVTTAGLSFKERVFFALQLCWLVSLKFFPITKESIKLFA